MSWHRFTEQLREYFTFTRKERNGIYVLLILLIILQGAILVTHFPNDAITPLEFSQFKKEILAFEKEAAEAHITSTIAIDETAGSTRNPSAISYFYFDPNTINTEQWLSMGVPWKTAQSIENYISKGGRFKKKEDLKKIYNLKPELYADLAPYISIKEEEKITVTDASTAKVVKPKVLVELNSAGVDDLMQLPMIGEKRAEQIIRYRDKIGGFVMKEQLKEVFSIPDSVYVLVAPQLTVNTALIHPLYINSINDTVYHPYLKKSLLKMIVSYRKEHGPYKSKAELKKLPLMTDSVYMKMESYFSLD